MREEIVIGTTDKAIFNSIRLWCGANIAENSKYYIFNVDITSSIDVRIYIAKDSNEGREICEWISHEENKNNDVIDKKAWDILFQQLTTDEILEVIKERESESFKNGYRTGQLNARNEMRRVLGL